MPYATDSDRKARRVIDGPPASRYIDLLHVRFPHVQATADELLGRSQAFRDLVEEYGLCADALDQLSQQQPCAPLLAHYAALRFALERLLLYQIVDQQRGPDPR